MSPSQIGKSTRVDVENVGGINSTSVKLSSGINVLTGKNATNRTSFLRSVMAALGSDNASLKADSDQGSVTLSIDGEAYERQFERKKGHVTTDGDPYLEDPTLANLFAFLLESNTARKAVSQQQDLREIIMRPIDVEDIKREIEDAQEKKNIIDRQIESISERQSNLPALEERRQTLQAELEEAETSLEARREELKAAQEAESEADRDLDEQLEALQNARNDIEDIRFKQETEQESIDHLETQLEGVRSEIESLPEAHQADAGAIESELEELRTQQSELDSSTTQLQSIIQFNEEMLQGTNPEITAALTAESDDEDELTDQLLSSGESVVCWTCGTTVETKQIEATIDRLRELRQQKVTARNELRQRIDDHKQRLASARETQQRRQTLFQRRDEIEMEIDDRQDRFEVLEERERELRTRIDDLEETVSELEAETESETLDRQKAVTEAEFRLEQKRRELEDVGSKITDIEASLDQLEALREQRETVADRMTELRTRIDRIERESVDAFNEHMASVLDVLEYENLERIWIEKSELTVREGRRKVNKTTFDLHIVRKNADGQTYEDTIEHLSESEREVTGLVFALAGYLVHEVYNEVPFMLLDSLEAIDSERIAALVEYFSQYAEIVLVALLPEDAGALDETYRYVSKI